MSSTFWNWAGEALHTYRDGLSRDERKDHMDVEDHKQVLYLRMHNVSAFFHLKLLRR